MNNMADFVTYAKKLLNDQAFTAVEKQAHLEAENYLRLNQSSSVVACTYFFNDGAAS